MAHFLLCSPSSDDRLSGEVMPLTWFERPLLALAAMVLPATLVYAALQNPTEAPAQASLAGQVLIAAPSLRDPRFDHTVVLMVRHNAGGALGIVLNHPLGERPWAQLLDAIGEKDSTATGSLRIFSGGPVQPEVGFVIHSTSSREILRDIASQHGPEKAIVAFGYAGWAGGQLEGELAQRAWFTAAADSKLIFDVDRDKVWDDAMAHRTQDL
jgi:putative transcriptional regulator